MSLALARYWLGWNLQSCETSQLLTTPGWFTSSLAVAQSPRDTVGMSPPYLSSSTSVLHCVTFSRASKGPLRCRRWTFESFPIGGHHVGYAECPHPLHATVHNHICYPRPLPLYVASIHRSGFSPYQYAPASHPLVHADRKAAQLRCALCVFMPSSLPS